MQVGLRQTMNNSNASENKKSKYNISAYLVEWDF